LAKQQFTVLYFLTKAVPVDSKAEKTTDVITHIIVTAINGDILVLQIKIQY